MVMILMIFTAEKCLEELIDDCILDRIIILSSKNGAGTLEKSL